LPRKSVDNLLSAIEKAKTIELPKFITALSIPHVGEETAYLLAEKFQFAISNLQKARKEELEIIEGIGPVMADAIVAWFADKENKKNLHHLLAHIKIESHSKLKTQNLKLSDKMFVLTGTLSKMSRDEAKEKVRALGGNISSAVSKTTDYIVAGENPGSKYEEARRLGVPVLTEADFLRMMGV